MTTGPNTTAETGLLPLVVGLVGRCPLPAHPEELRSQIKNILCDKIKKQHPRTPVIILSAVVQGATRVAVEAALDCHVELVVPLPIPRRCYKPELLDWIQKNSSQQFDIPLADCIADTDLDDEAGKARHLQHALGDAYIARYCDILIAIQDDHEEVSCLPFGVRHIIEFKLNGRFDRDGTPEFDRQLQTHLDRVPEPYWLRRSALYPPESGPVYHIVISGDKASQPVLHLPEEFANDPKKGEAFYARMQQHVETLNAHAIAIGDDPGQVKYRDDSREWLLKDSEAERLNRALQEMRQCYHNADILAMHFQSKTTRTLRILCITAFLAAASFIAYAHLLIHEAAPWPLAIYFLAVAVAFRYYINAQRLDFQNKYQDYRAIAEGLRVQFFWRLAGLDSSAAEYYLLKQTSELDWIRKVIRACALRAEPAGRDRIPLVLQRWVRDQEAFFSKKAPANRKELIVYKYLGDGFLLVSLMLAIYVLLAFLVTELIHGLEGSVSSSTEIFSQLLAILIGAVLLFFLYHLIKQISEQYKNLRDESLPKESATAESNAGGARPVDELKKQIEILTAKPLNNLLLGIAGGLLLATLVCFAPNAIPFWSQIKLKTDTAEFLIAGIGMTAVVGGLLHYYAEKRAFSEHAKQYNRMAIIFRNAAERLSNFHYPEDYEKAASLIKELGIEALAENGDWVLLHRERPLEPVRSMEG